MSVRVPFLDLGADFREVEKEARRRVDAVLASQCFVLGPETAALEASVAELVGVPFAVACSSGSDALFLALQALGIGAGDAVLVPAFTFFATAGAVVRAGAQPIFCDVDPATLNLGGREVEAAIERELDGDLRHRRSGAALRAILPVHLFGRAVAMDELAAVAARRGVLLIEDAAQAIGCVGERGPVGAWGAIGCFSFYPTKNLGGAGDGGMLTTASEALAAKLRRLRAHGSTPGEYRHHEAGINARMAELVAAVLNAKLTRLAHWTRARRRVANRYRHRLTGPARDGALVLPPPAREAADVHHVFTVRMVAGMRDRVHAALAGDGVETRVFYPLPLHLQPCFGALGYRAGELPVAERAANEVLSLPVYPSLSDEQVDFVCERLAAALGA